MSNKALYIIVAVLILLGLGFYVYNSRQTQAPTVENSNTAAPTNQETSTTNDATGTSLANTPEAANPDTHFSGEADIQPAVHQITYNGTGFSPATLTVKAGDTVVFKNTSTTAVWPASDPHPTHTAYPEFDSKKAVPAGGTYSFIFTKVGTWGYHNHLNSSQKGTIIVTQ